MPSPRKRIGFLPRIEIQELIDEICKENKLSQSKVTGILVEEALFSRGVLKSGIKEDKSLLINKSKECLSHKKNELKYISDLSFNKININEEIKMINNFIEYKFFKEIMNRNNE